MVEVIDDPENGLGATSALLAVFAAVGRTEGVRILQGAVDAGAEAGRHRWWSARTTRWCAWARRAGVQLRLAGDGRGRPEDAPPALLAQLRACQAELAGLLRGDACPRCGRAIAWRREGVAFDDGMAMHVGCYEDG